MRAVIAAGNDVEDVESTLARYSALTRRAMAGYLAEGTPAGYLYDLVREYPARGGKGIRPALVYATCQAFGGSITEATGSAVAIELAHNAFLVHDDVEDDSLQRRGLPTLHRLHGVPLAVNAGDALAVLALRPLRDRTPLGSRLSQRVMDEFVTMIQRTIEGQAIELGWRADNVVTLGPDDYLELIAQKTCWYTTVWPLRVGALIGSRATAPLEALTRFGFYLGAAFQIRDDLLNIVGSEDVYGKELLGDIREGKRTLMLIHLLQEATADERSWLTEYLARPESSRVQAEAEEILQLMGRRGSIEFAFEFGRGIAAAADAAFEEAFRDVPPSHHTEFVRGLIGYMLGRTS